MGKGEAPPAKRRLRQARSRRLAGGEIWEGRIWQKESGRFRTRLSNLRYYAVTGVKAQAFVPVLFYRRLV
jgi:hypothetical protein